MSKSSNVGSSGVYEAGDQRTVPRSEVQHHPRYEEGKEGSHHSLDSSTSPQPLLVKWTLQVMPVYFSQTYVSGVARLSLADCVLAHLQKINVPSPTD